MRDKRTVDELSIEELERILLVKKRESRMQRFAGGNTGKEERRAAPLPVPAPSAEVVTVQPEPPAPLDDGGVPRFEDDLLLEQARAYPPVIGYAAPPSTPNKRGALNTFFMLVELVAIAGLVGVLYLAYRGLTQVNQNIEKTDIITATSEAELALRQIQPSATPLISVRQVVLPGGHIWDASGQHRFNLNEVPGPYRSEFEKQLSAPRTEFIQTPEGGPIRIQIPAIDVDASVRSGDDWITLQAGVGHHPFSGNPGQQGNMVLTAHNDIFGEIFRRTEELNPGDEIRIQSANGQWYTYVVREKQVVEPTEVWVLDQSLGQNTPLTTLITCYPYRVDTHRMIVFAELISTS